MLFEESRAELALIDHGFAFAREQDLRHTAILVDWRMRAGLAELVEVEIAALELLLGGDELLGLKRDLDPDRADALAQRAGAMRQTRRLV